MKIIFFLLLIFDAHLAFCLDENYTEEAYRTLGLSPVSQPSPTDINSAYKKRINRLVSGVMDGDPEAIRQSQMIAQARYLLLNEGKLSCPDMLVTDEEPKKSNAQPVSNSDLEIQFLNEMHPEIFPPNFNPFDQGALHLLVRTLMIHPKEVVETFTLDEKILKDRYPADPSTSLIGSYQKSVALTLGKALKRTRMEHPQWLRGYEEALTAGLIQLHNETDRLLILLHAIMDLHLPPGQSLFAVIPLLDDVRPVVRSLATGILLQSAAQDGWSPVFEGELKHVKNEIVLRILLASRKALFPETYGYIIDRLSEIHDPFIFRSVVHELFDSKSQDAELLKKLSEIRDNAEAERIIRFASAEELIERGQEVALSTAFMIFQLPTATGDELFHVANWCFSSPRCPSSLREAIDGARVPQRHQN